MSKETVIFLHIPKTAGTTIRDITRRQYSPKFVLNISSNLTDEEQATSFLTAKSKKISLIQGHFGFGGHELIPNSCTYFTFLRNPINRFISAYYHINQNPNHYLYKIVKNFTLDEYVRSNLIEEQTLDNIQVRFLSGYQGKINRKNKLSNSDLKQAKINLENFFIVIGFVEEFDYSLVMLKEQLNWQNIYYSIRNNRVGKPNKNKISRETWNLIKKYNELDLMLYNEYFDKVQTNKSEIFMRKVDKFQNQNLKLSNKGLAYIASRFSGLRQLIYQYSGL